MNYDFNILHYGEFEELTRDLLQAEFGTYIESFKDGKDGGIDLRFGLADGGKCIVQCKRYKNWSSLKEKLKDEAEKVKKLKPKRYILSTSAKLSANNKEEIQKIFGKYIKDPEDIYGREDLNNILGHHPEIEQQYYKLWIGGTRVLNSIIHKKIVNWSNFERKKIKDEVRRYVQNSSYNEALKILDKHHYIILSGVPGMGKTTLARMLVYHKLANGYNELVRVHDMDDANNMYQEGKKQVFFADDIFGKTSLDKAWLRANGEKLSTFIEEVRKSEDKLFIITTRSYVFAQAVAADEITGNSNYDIAECVLDMSAYNEDIRTKILYNHMADAHLPKEYVGELLRDQNYLEIIQHRNYSPRVIENYIDKGGWGKYPASQFVPAFVEWIDTSKTVWEYTFKNLAAIEKHALLVLSTMNDQEYEDMWYKAFQAYCEKLPLSMQFPLTDEKWREVLDTLDGTFIDVYEEKNGKIYVLWNNSSAQDYVIQYIRTYEDEQKRLICGARYLDQLYSIFTNREDLTKAIRGYVLVSPQMSELIQKRSIEIMEGEDPAYVLKVKRNGVYDRLCEMEVISFFIGMHKKTGIVEHFLTRDDFFDPNMPIQLRLSLLNDIDYSKVDFTADEVVASIMDEGNFDVSDAVELIETANLMDRLDWIRDMLFILELNAMVERAIKDSALSSIKIKIIKGQVRRIARILPEHFFPKEKYMQKIANLEEDIAILLTDEDVLAREDRNEADMKRIDDLMTSLKVNEN